MARIMIVDDSSIVRRNLAAILTEAGHTIVAEAENGVEACNQYDLHKPDLVTMDITMPLMDGITAVDKIMDDHPEAVIVMISAIDQKSQVMKAIDSGARNYIIKPFTPEKAIKTINQVIDHPPVSKRVKHLPPFPAAASVVSLKPPSGTNVFNIENRQGTFIIHISEHFNNNYVPQLNDTIRAFLYVKPLRIIFNFGSNQIKENAVLNNLGEMMNAVRQSGGLVMVSARDERISSFYLSMGINCN